MTAIKVWVWRSGYRLSSKERARIGRDLGHHAGCWINDYDCGDPTCPMAHHDGRPEEAVLGARGEATLPKEEK